MTEAFIEACEVVSVSPEIARDAAQLRVAHPKLKMPDALIIATSTLHSERVIGNDRAWIGICESFELVDVSNRGSTSDRHVHRTPQPVVSEA